MARGWESKAVETQQQEAIDSVGRKGSPAPRIEDPARRAERDTLMLSRARALAELQSACAPAHRASLEMAIASLDERIALINALCS